MDNTQVTINELYASIQELKNKFQMYIDGKETVRTYTIAEACEQMKISRTTFDRLRKASKISVTKVGGKQYVSQAAINAYLSI